jgi:hypothetical protein
MPRAVLILFLLIRVSVASETDVLFELQRKAFDFFWLEANPESGLLKDRAKNHGTDQYDVASIASTGFGLAAIPIAVERGWIPRAHGEARAKLTLQSFAGKLTNEHGWFYHFVNWKTGARVWNCEISSIDTTLLLAGALAAGEYFGGETQSLADSIYRRVDFPWMLTDGGARPDCKTLSMGWRPESGFIKSRWDTYSEHILLQILALGSPTHPIAADTWLAWKRDVGEYKGHKTFACGPLFTHQYSQAFLDLRNRRDSLGHDYFESSIQATLANRQFCIDQSGKFKTYSTNIWGLSACDNPDKSYEAYGAPPGYIHHDGTISPWNTAASVVFTPELVVASVKEMRHSQPRLWGRYGFAGAFNLDREWFAPDVIGIDLGAAVLMIENYRSGQVWSGFMKIPAIQAGLKNAELN